MPGESFEHRRRLRRAVAFAGDGRGRKLGISRRRDQIDPDADDQKSQVAVLSDFRFEQEAGDLTAADQHVVWPF